MEKEQICFIIQLQKMSSNINRKREENMKDLFKRNVLSLNSGDLQDNLSPNKRTFLYVI